MKFRGALFAVATLSFHLPGLKAEDLFAPHRGAIVPLGVRLPHHDATAHLAAPRSSSSSSSSSSPQPAACLARWEDCTRDWKGCCDGLTCARIDAAGSGRCLDKERTCSDRCGAEEPPPPSGDGGFRDAYSDRVRVNQVGYLRLASKVGVVVDDSPTPIEWQILDALGSVVLNGTTTAYGLDGASLDRVHRADFSPLAAAGDYRLVARGIGTSREFRVAPRLYPDLPREAMNYFYFHRMGVKIEGEHLVDGRYARGAIHPGDAAVPPYPGWCEGCDEFDLWGSWADAGDFGIYTVNHAISAWTLLNLRELFPDAFGDGELNLPESGNGIPDVLDEVDFGSRFVRGMLPSDGGLASHKAHNHAWSSFTVTVEGENAGARSAMGPSTSATYAVARVNAQLARAWHSENGDANHTSILWDAAKDAWSRADGTSEAYNAAEASPGPAVGGGDYPDARVDDDRYAAACEMYLTAYALGDEDVGTYRTAVRTYARFTGMGQWDWRTVTGAGTLSLYAAESDLSPADRHWIKENIVGFANKVRAAVDSEGYPSNLAYPSEFGKYPWGSNSFILNRMIALAYAHEITGDVAYQKYILRSMDYIMGTNAMGISYVTGYGEDAETDTHDRWAWTVGQDAHWPRGWLSGGPNDELINDYETPGGVAAAKSYAGRGTAPYAWGSKENTVNWNAPLAWIAWYIENRIVPNLGGCGADDCPPLAGSLSVTLRMDAFVDLTLSANDYDGAVTAWEIVDPPGFGTLSGDAPDLTYTPVRGAVGTDTFTFRAIDDSGGVSNIASVTLLVQDCDFVDIFEVPSPFPPSHGSYNYDYVYVSEDGPRLGDTNTPAHYVRWDDAQQLLQFSLSFEGPPYYVELASCMPARTFSGANASFSLSGCGVDGLDGDYWIAQRDGNEVWVEKNNGWALVFTNDADYEPRICRSSSPGPAGLQASRATVGPTSSPKNTYANDPAVQPTNNPSRSPSNQSNQTSSSPSSGELTASPPPNSTESSTKELIDQPTNNSSKEPFNQSNITSNSPTSSPSVQPSSSPMKATSDPLSTPPTKAPIFPDSEVTSDPSSSPTRSPTENPTFFTSSSDDNSKTDPTSGPTNQPTTAPTKNPAPQTTPPVTPIPIPEPIETICCTGRDSGYQVCKPDALCSTNPAECGKCNGVIVSVPLQRTGCCSWEGQDCSSLDPTANPSCQYMISDCEGRCSGTWQPF